MTNSPVLVTGATGDVGAKLIRLLSASGIAARAMLRSAKGAEQFAGLPHVDTVFGDFDDPASLVRILAGIERAFLLTNSTERAERQQLDFVAAAGRAGVRRVVKLSQIHADKASPVRYLRYHAAVEEALRQSGMAYTFLRPNLFMQTLLAFKASIAASGQFFAPIGDARVSLVDTRDIAAVAARALTEDGHAGKTYDITGPEALTHGEIAAAMSRSFGRPIAFMDVPPAAMRAAVIDLGFPAWQVDGLIEDYAHYVRGEASGISTDAERVTGRPARSLDGFLADYRGEFIPG